MNLASSLESQLTAGEKMSSDWPEFFSSSLGVDNTVPGLVLVERTLVIRYLGRTEVRKVKVITT